MMFSALHSVLPSILTVIKKFQATFLKKLEHIAACTRAVSFYFIFFSSDQAQHMWTRVGCLETYHFVKILAARFGAHVACTVTFTSIW